MFPRQKRHRVLAQTGTEEPKKDPRKPHSVLRRFLPIPLLQKTMAPNRLRVMKYWQLLKDVSIPTLRLITQPQCYDKNIRLLCNLNPIVKTYLDSIEVSLMHSLSYQCRDACLIAVLTTPPSGLCNGAPTMHFAHGLLDVRNPLSCQEHLLICY